MCGYSAFDDFGGVEEYWENWTVEEIGDCAVGFEGEGSSGGVMCVENFDKFNDSISLSHASSVDSKPR